MHKFKKIKLNQKISYYGQLIILNSLLYKKLDNIIARNELFSLTHIWALQNF